MKKLTLALLLAPLSVFANTAPEQKCSASYALKVNTQTVFDFQGASVTRHKFTGFLSVRPMPLSHSEVEGATWWGLQMTEVTQMGNGQKMADDLVYSLPFAVLRAADGRLLDYKFPAKIDPESQDKLKGLTNYLQFPASKAQVLATQHRQEIDTIGAVQVAYYDEQSKTSIKSDDPSLYEFKRQKVQYESYENVHTSSHQVGQALQKIDVVESNQYVTINDCWLESTRGAEKLHIASPGNGYKMDTQQSYSVVKKLKLVDSLLWQMPEQVALWQVQETKDVELTPEQLKALAAKLRQDLQNMNLLELRGSQLGEWLKQFEPVIHVVGDMIKEGLFDDKQNMRVLNALGQMDTANGNKLLVNLMGDAELDETNRFRAMRAITTGTSALTPELTEQMVELLLNEDFPGSETIRGSALMALGAVIERREGNEHSERLLNELTNKLTASSSEGEQAALVASLGNSRKPEVVETLTDYSQSDSPRVRANAAASLGQVGDEKAHKALSNMLHAESNPKAQQAVVGAMANFELSPSDIGKVTDIAKASKSERTRGNAIKALANQGHEGPLVQQKLKELMKSEGSRKNFALAARSLTAIRKQQAEADDGGN